MKEGECMKLVIKIISLILLLIIGMVVSSAAPTLTNDLAMMQLENSNALFVMWDVYIKVRPIVTFIYVLTISLFSLSIARDFVKAKSAKTSSN